MKLHNGFSTSTAGNLEVYFADASTSLSWPTGWTLIGTVSVSGFAAHTTKVVEQAWSPPGTGHFCLLARWVSASDPMAVAEGTDIEANVRNNNNIVWRNVNVVDLAGDQSSDATVIVRNDSDQRVPATLTIGGPRGGLRPSFTTQGQVLVRFDDRLADVWQKSGHKGSGFKRDGNLLLVGREGAWIDNLILPPHFEGRMTLRFRKLPSTQKRVFELDVTQSAGTRTIGGVSYEIHTERHHH